MNAQQQEVVFAQCGNLRNLPDNNCVATNRFTLTVLGAPGNQLGFNVRLKEVRLIVQHEWVEDLVIKLYAPNGKNILLFQNDGAATDHIGDPTDPGCTRYVRFTMAGCTTTANGFGPFLNDGSLGTWLPREPFTKLNGVAPNGNWVFELCDTRQDDAGILKHVALVFTEDLCVPAPAAKVTEIQAFQTRVTWPSTTQADSIYIIYGPKGFYPGTGDEPGQGSLLRRRISSSDTSIVITGLEAQTAYDVYYRTRCGQTITSSGCQGSWITYCDTPPLTLVEGFQTQSITSSPRCGSTADFVNSTWRNIRPGDDLDWLVARQKSSTPRTGPSSGVGGSGNFVYLEPGSGANICPGKTALLSSHCLDVTAPVIDCHLSFWFHMYGDQMGSLTLEASTDGGNTWFSLWSRSGNQGDQWYRQYIDLSPFHQQVIQLRFRGITGSGPRSEMALDQIEFYGPNSLGISVNTFYRDQDGDGFGNPMMPLPSCASVAPNGYVSNSSDCNDQVPGIHPGVNEIICNQVDENCNGMADDRVVPAPNLPTLQACENTPFQYVIPGSPYGNWYWFTDPVQRSPISIDTLHAGILQGNVTFYVQDSLPGVCASSRIPVAVVLNTAPHINLLSPVERCQGQTLRLNELPIVDQHSSAPVFNWYNNLPFGPATNLSTSGFTVPAGATNTWVEAINNAGCRDSLIVPVVGLPGPAIHLIPTPGFQVCPGENLSIIAAISNANAPYNFQWNYNNSSTNPLVVSNFAPGVQNYQVTVTDSDGCSNTAGIEIQGGAGVSRVEVLSIQPVSACNTADGKLVLLPKNGIGPFTVYWTGNVNGNGIFQDTITIESLVQGAYKIAIFDAQSNLCAFEINPLVIDGPGILVENVLIENTRCADSKDGRIQLQVQGGNLTYQWSTSQGNGPLANGLGVGNNSVTISNPNCNLIINDLLIASPLALNAVFQVNKPACTGTPGGSIQVFPNGGEAPYSFQWSQGANGLFLQGVGAGIYNGVLTDSRGCTWNSGDILLNDPLALEVVSTVQQPSCHQSADGGIDLRPIGGTFPYAIQWSNGLTQEDLYLLGPGLYQATVTDALGCTATSVNHLLQNPLPIQTVLDQVSSPTCAGASDGILEARVTGGVAPYLIQWSNGATGTPIKVGSGIYSAIVTDANGCIHVAGSTISVSAPQLMSPGAPPFISDAFCNGVDNGKIAVVMQGGVPPYQYSWSNGDTSSQVNALAAGEYTLTVTDQNQCTWVSPTYKVHQSIVDQAGYELIQQVNCKGSANGAIVPQLPSVARAPLEFYWSNGASTPGLQSLVPGQYSGFVIDAQGCRFELPIVTITEPDQALKVTLNTIHPPDCSGRNNGSIDIETQGGTAPYAYTWSNNASSEDLSNVKAGDYWVSVTDASGCAVTLSSISVVEPTPIRINIGVIQPAGCGGAKGAVRIDAIGGAEPYSIRWENGSTTPELSNLLPGIYSVTVQDANGCSGQRSNIQIALRGDSIGVDPGPINPVRCFGESNGSIGPVTSNGQSPFQVLWSNGMHAPTLQQLSAGSYSVTLVDAIGCVGVLNNIVITEPEPIQIQNPIVSPAACFGEATGQIELVASGGTKPYQVQWQPGNFTGLKVQGLLAGAYSYSFTDARGCQFQPQSAIQVEGPVAALSSNIVLQKPVSCRDGIDGALMAQATGGKRPYQYEWNNGLQTLSIEQIPAGNYRLSVTDALGCQEVSEVFTLGQPDAYLRVEGYQTAASNGQSNGSAWSRVYGGKPPYRFIWYNSTGTQVGLDSLLDQIPADEYMLAVLDANECEVRIKVLVESALGIGELPSFLWTIAPNPASEFLVVDTKIEVEAIFLFDALGNMVRTVHSSDKTVRIPLGNLPSGLYWCRLSAFDGRQGLRAIVIE